MTHLETPARRGGQRSDPGPVRRRLSRRRKLLYIACSVLISTGVALFLGEVALRVSWGDLLSTRDLRLRRGLAEGASAVYDAHLGWRSRPGEYRWSDEWATHRKDESAWVSLVNEDGTRSNGHPPPAGGPPILAVGDSYTFGSEVADAETWPAQLELALGQPVVNAGVPGYGVDQAVMNAEALVDRVHPATVLLTVIPDDITRCEMSQYFAAKPYFDIVDDELQLRNQPVPRPEDQGLWTILGRSFLVRKVLLAVAPDVWMAKTRAHYHGVEVVNRLIARLAAQLQQRGIKLVLIAMASRMGISKDLTAVADRARQRGVPVLDLATKLGPKFHSEYGDRPSWYLKMGHLRPEGNAIVAKTIAAFLSEHR